MSKPVVDEIFELIIQRRLDELDSISRPEDAVYIRTIVSTDNDGGANLGFNLEEITSVAPWITPFFKGPRILVSSLSTAVQGVLTGGKANFLIDWSFSFDSNVAEKVRAYMNEEDINPTDLERVITLLKLKNKFSLQTDLLPFLFENLRLSRNDKSNDRPLDTIIAFKKLDFMDWDAFEKDPTKPKFKCIDESCLLNDARDTYDSLVNDAELKRWEYKALFTQVILFELAIIWLKKESSPEEQFSELIDFCVLQLGKLPKYELKFAWRFFSHPTKTRFFGPLNGVAKKLVKALKGMAWDMCHLRILEMLATKSELGSFYLPFFVSFDEKFSEILKENQVQLLVVDDRLKRMHSATVDEYEFLQNLDRYMSLATKSQMEPAKSELRRKYQVPSHDLEQILRYQTTEVERLAVLERERRASKAKT
ncbi:hypothetical protein J8L98_13170 [Pseudoalteromonas sp. MMG013]|uniref:hypothetical protein n=1 Tax=Pseudoalteromonas sp. MMG013 TaxID=2822687 RepID=UPI001B381D0B|nr:hypothetical protein [Pseudoalteromonas sp. MMG013]MBQ4862640.1 hypothetical protein [Pseudoalteromonas sp. MMG013]